MTGRKGDGQCARAAGRQRSRRNRLFSNYLEASCGPSRPAGRMSRSSLGGTAWQHLAILGYHALAGQAVRLVVALVPFLLLAVLACYQYAGRYLEVWFIVLVRYHLRPKRYLWRSIRYFEPHLYPLVGAREDSAREEDGGNTLLLSERKQP